VWAPTSPRSGDGRCTEAHELSAKRRIPVATEELVCAASLGEAFKLLTQVLPLGRGAVVERNGKIYVA
jgi:hypothetical protein